MSQEFLNLLARLAPGEKPEQLARTAEVLDALRDGLASVLTNLKDASAQEELLAHFSASALAALVKRRAEADRVHLTPELLEWARNEYTDEEIVASIEEALRTGGKELSEFIHELV